MKNMNHLKVATNNKGGHHHQNDDFESMSEEEMVAHSQAEAVASGAVELDGDEVEYSEYVKNDEDEESSYMNSHIEQANSTNLMQQRNNGAISG